MGRGASQQTNGTTVPGRGLSQATTLMALKDGESSLAGQAKFLLEALQRPENFPPAEAISERLQERESAVAELQAAAGERPQPDNDAENAMDPRWQVVDAYTSLALYHQKAGDGKVANEYWEKAESFRDSLKELDLVTEATNGLRKMLEADQQLAKDVRDAAEEVKGEPIFSKAEHLRNWWWDRFEGAEEPPFGVASWPEVIRIEPELVG